MWIYIIVSLVLTGLLLAGLHFAMIKWAGFLASREFLFATPKVSRIMARSRNGKITGYLANLAGLGHTIDLKTGELSDGQDKNHGWVWDRYGVLWIGFDTIHKYEITRTKIDSEGKYVDENVEAESVFFAQSWPLCFSGMETKEGVKITVILNVNLQTTNARLCLKYKNWVTVVNPAIKSACRDFIGSQELREIYSTPHEGKITSEKETLAKSSFVELILSLNGDEGNIGLPGNVGQKIVSCNLVSIEIEDKDIREQLQATLKAKEAGHALIMAAELDADKAKIELAARTSRAEALLVEKKKEAEGIQAIGDANNKVLEERVKAFGGKPELLAEIMRAEGYKAGTLVFGNASLLIKEGKDG